MTDNSDHTIPEPHLIQGVKNHNIKAMEQLYDLYAAPLFGVVVRIVKNEDEAEAVLVESFTQAWEEIEDYSPVETPFYQHLATIGQNKAHEKESLKSNINSNHRFAFTNLSDFIEFAIEPRHKVKDKLKHKLEEIERHKKALERGPHRPVYVAPELHFNHKKRDKYQWLLAACFTLLIISNIVSFYVYQRWKRTQSQLADAEMEQMRLNEAVNTDQQKIAQLQTAIVVLGDEQMKQVILKGQEKSPESQAMVHYNPKTKQVFLELKQLTLAPKGHQFQLWALDITGKPLNAGLIPENFSLEGMQQMKPISQGRTFMITLEDIGGNSEPTLEQIYLLGKL